MPGCDIFRADAVGVVEKRAEFDLPVAGNAGIRRLAAQIRVDERLDDKRAEALAQIKHGKIDIQRLCRRLRAVIRRACVV